MLLYSVIIKLMKKKRKNYGLFSPIIFLCLFLIGLITFIAPKSTPSQKNSDQVLSSSDLPPIFSFRDLISHKLKTTSLIATGDIMLGRYCNVQMLNKKDWKYLFSKTASFTSNADITFGNLEAPFVENCPTTETGMIFCARPESIEGLKFAGFDVLSLANNHILNHGQKGLDQTKNLLEKNNILPSQNEITIYRYNDLRFGFLSFDLVTYPPPRLAVSGEAGQTSLISQITQITPTVDVLIVSLHWGNEYQKQPTKSQIDLAHQIIDSGAKIVIGHHPHVAQPEEKYNNGLIFYSLGNFIFDQPWSEETKKSQLAKIIFEGKNIKSYEIVPIYIENYCLPALLQ